MDEMYHCGGNTVNFSAMTIETRKLLARRSMGYASLSDFVGWGAFMLEEGYDTEHLRMLASLNYAPDWWEIEYYFGKTIQELGWHIPEPKQLLRFYAKDVAEAILHGNLSPEDGCHQIYSVYRDLDYTPDMQTWLYLADGLEPGTHSDLSDKELDVAIQHEAKVLLQAL